MIYVYLELITIKMNEIEIEFKRYTQIKRDCCIDNEKENQSRTKLMN